MLYHEISFIAQESITKTKKPTILKLRKFQQRAFKQVYSVKINKSIQHYKLEYSRKELSMHK